MEYKEHTLNLSILNGDNATAPQKTANAGEDVQKAEPWLATSGATK